MVGDNKIDWWLPIIVNPFADIAPFIPKVVDGDANLNQALVYSKDQYNHVPWFHFVQDISPKHVIMPEPDDTAFPQATKHGQGTRLFVQVYGPSDKDKFYLKEAIWIQQAVNPHILDATGMQAWQEQIFNPIDVRDHANGLWIEIPPVQFSRNLSTTEVAQIPIVPSTYSNFTQIKSLSTHTFWKPIFNVCDEKTAAFDMDAWLSWFPFLANKNADSSGVPLIAIFCHEQKYYYYGRTRKQSGKVILEEYSLPIYAKVQLDLLDWAAVTIHVGGGGDVIA